MPPTAEIKVLIAGDASQAAFFIPPGTPAVDAKMLAMLASGSGVANSQAIERTIATIAAGYKPSAEPQTVPFVRSTPPVHGHDGRVDWATGFDPNAKATSQDAARTDHYAGQNYVRVTAGNILGTMVEPTAGTDGRDVKGGVIKANRGKAIPVSLHPTVTRDSLSRIVAQADGVFILRDGQLSVGDSLRLHGSVDFATGNVDFSGSVEVLGGVSSGFKVKAGKDVSIGTLIECAEIRCGGNFTAKGGIVGHDKGTLNVQGNADVVYIEKVTGEVHGSLIVERELVDCRLIVGKDLKCPNGTILGGQMVITGSLVVKSLGSEAETPTTLVLGDVPLLADSRAQELKAIEQINTQLRQFSEQERLIKLNPRPTAADRERLTECSYETSQLTADLTKRLAKVRAVDEAFKSQQRLDLHIAKVIHPKVKFQIGEFSVLFKTAVKGPIWIGWDDRKQLVFKNSSGVSRPLSDIALVLQGKPAAVAA